MNYSIWSQAFLDIADDATCFVEEREWSRLHDIYPDAKRLFGRVGYEGDWVYFALGNPVRANDIHSQEELATLFIPYWIQEHLGLEGSGETLEVEWFQGDSFPDATKIVLRPHDVAFHDLDVKEELERALTRYGILQSGSTIPITILSMGNYKIHFDIVSTEPASLVLLEGDEVEIEFETAINATEGIDTNPAESARPDTPLPFNNDVLIPIPTVSVVPGILLGGTSRPRLPDGRAWNPWR